MSTSDANPIDDLPSGWSSMWRVVKFGHRAEPRMLLAAFAMVVIVAIPDAFVALWLALLSDGVIDGSRTQTVVAALGLAASSTGTWYLQVLFTRLDRRFRDRISIAFQAHVAELQASVATIEHHERPAYLDRLSVLRDQVFALDHLFGSMFATLGWLLRLGITVVLLASIHPVLVLLVVFAAPTAVVATLRPKTEREVEESVAAHDRLARHLFTLATTASPGKELRVARTADLVAERRHEAWAAWYGPVAGARRTTALWHVGAWALFGAAFTAAVVFVAAGVEAGVGSVVLVLVAGGRLSAYIGSAVQELGFLRGIWLDSSQRLAWLEDYAASKDAGADLHAPDRLVDGIRFEHVSFRYPGTERLVLDDVDLHLPAGAVVAVVGENGAGKTTLVKLLARMYEPDAGRILADGVDLARVPHGEWRERMSGAFQDFARLELRALTTVGLGDEPRSEDRVAVGGAVDRAGASGLVEQLREGLDTQLGPTWEGGVDVSFGQWQKLALARGFMRDTPLVLVLDEPTSALDAETEHALFERYADAARQGAADGRVTVLVSHRFSTVRMADLIVVLDGARVAEVGSHDELMARDGTYAELYRIQATAYR